MAASDRYRVWEFAEGDGPHVLLVSEDSDDDYPKMLKGLARDFQIADPYSRNFAHVIRMLKPFDDQDWTWTWPAILSLEAGRQKDLPALRQTLAPRGYQQVDGYAGTYLYPVGWDVGYGPFLEVEYALPLELVAYWDREVGPPRYVEQAEQARQGRSDDNED